MLARWMIFGVAFLGLWSIEPAFSSHPKVVLLTSLNFDAEKSL